MQDEVNRHLAKIGSRITTGTVAMRPSSMCPVPPRVRLVNATGDASDQERAAVVFRSEDAHRRGWQRGRGASVCNGVGQRGGLPYMLSDLLGEDRKVWGDEGYQGQGDAIRKAAPHAQDKTRIHF